VDNAETINHCPGDVIFTRAAGLRGTISAFVQREIDLLAVASKNSFSHVAVVLSQEMALEAVPFYGGEEEIEKWSGVKLTPGVTR
jgi:hypothetical protein